MPRRITWKTWLPLLAIGGALLAVYRLRADLAPLLPPYIAPDSVFTAFLVLGFIVIVLGLLFLALSPVYGVVRELSQWLPFKFGYRHYRARHAKGNDLRTLHAWFTSAFGEENTDFERVKQWHKRNKKLHLLLYQARYARGRLIKQQDLVAAFSFIPITAEALRLLDRNELSGGTLEAKHIVPVGKIPGGAYIGGVIARTTHARVHILRRLKYKVEEFREDGLSVYTRPITSDGLRLVKKYGFTPVESGYTQVQLHQLCKV